jgi:hypothetical protein
VSEAWIPAEPDELDARYRALEAERLRPVPPPPGTQEALAAAIKSRLAAPKDPTEDFKRRLDAFEQRLKAFGRRHHPPENTDEQDD